MDDSPPDETVQSGRPERPGQPVVARLRAGVERHGFLTGSVAVLLLTALGYAIVLRNFWTRGVAFIQQGDSVALAAGLLSVSETGILDTNAHLDENFSAWTQPVLGLYTSGVMRLSAPFDLNAAQLIVVASLTSGLLVAWTVYAVATPLVRSRVYAAVLALAIALSPFCMIRAAGHLSVFACYLPIAAIGAMVVATHHRKFLVLTLILGMLSSPWWQAATPVLVAAVVLIAVFVRNRDVTFRAIRTGLALIPGVVISTLLVMRFPVQDDLAPTRGAWDSNVYGGHFMDVVANAPLLAKVRGINLTDLAPGLSQESAGVGSVVVFFILIALAFSAYRVLRPTAPADPDDATEETSALHIVTVATVATFLLGGFGNLQAGIAVILNSESPARVWSRFSIVVAVIIGVYAMRSMRSAPRALAAALLAVTAVIAFADFKVTAGQTHATAPMTRDFDLSSAEVKKFAASGCTIVQVPLATYPMVRAAKPTSEYNQTFYYEDLRPYLAYPQLTWSAGAPLLEGGKPALNALPEEVRRRPSAKYCGYLVDWDFYRYLRNNKQLTAKERTFFGAVPGPTKGAGRYEFRTF